MSEAQLCQTPLRMNGYFGNLLFCLKRIFCRISSFSRSHFLRPETILHIFRFETYFGNAFEDFFSFCHPFLFSSFGFIFLLDLFWENIYDRVKSNFENIGCSDLLFKVSVFVLRCIFGYYRHRARKLARNLTIGQSLSNSCFSKF